MLTHRLVQGELARHGPVIHAQKIIQVNQLQGVGHDVLFPHKVVAEELLHPGPLQLRLYFLHTDNQDKHSLPFLPEERQLPHSLHGEVFAGPAGKQRIIFQSFEYVLL